MPAQRVGTEMHLAALKILIWLWKGAFPFFFSSLTHLFFPLSHLLLLHINNLHFDQNTKGMKFPLGPFFSHFNTGCYFKEKSTSKEKAPLWFYLYVNQIGSLRFLFPTYSLIKHCPLSNSLNCLQQLVISAPSQLKMHRRVRCFNGCQLVKHVERLKVEDVLVREFKTVQRERGGEPGRKKNKMNLFNE